MWKRSVLTFPLLPEAISAPISVLRAVMIHQTAHKSSRRLQSSSCFTFARLASTIALFALYADGVIRVLLRLPAWDANKPVYLSLVISASFEIGFGG